MRLNIQLTKYYIKWIVIICLIIIITDFPIYHEINSKRKIINNMIQNIKNEAMVRGNVDVNSLEDDIRNAIKNKTISGYYDGKTNLILTLDQFKEIIKNRSFISYDYITTSFKYPHVKNGYYFFFERPGYYIVVNGYNLNDVFDIIFYYYPDNSYICRLSDFTNFEIDTFSDLFEDIKDNLPVFIFFASIFLCYLYNIISPLSNGKSYKNYK